MVSQALASADALRDQIVPECVHDGTMDFANVTPASDTSAPVTPASDTSASTQTKDSPRSYSLAKVTSVECVQQPKEKLLTKKSVSFGDLNEAYSPEATEPKLVEMTIDDGEGCRAYIAESKKRKIASRTILTDEDEFRSPTVSTSVAGFKLPSMCSIKIPLR